MNIEQLDYYLPPELIAQHPAEVRSGSRLLVFDRSGGELVDSRFERIGDFLRSGDCLVLNNTKVLAARFFGRRLTGGKIEGLFLAAVGDLWEVMLKGARKVKTGETICLTDRRKVDFCRAEVVEKRDEGVCQLRVEGGEDFEGILDEIGFAPLPPYIKRTDDADSASADMLRYQTVYAEKYGAVAAPTAGLHFTEELIGRLRDAGVCLAYVTLHVGMGTFKPVTAETLEEHEMHSERFEIDEENADIINAAAEKGGRIVAVGTTSVRTLETVAADRRVRAGMGATDLFIRPGYEFGIVDAMVTNFHLPKSTLIALVGAFGGLDNILRAYDYAIKGGYRFYSYGDAMLIL